MADDNNKSSVPMQNGGLTTVSADVGTYRYISLAKEDGGTVLSGRAPATGVSIEESVDLQLSKELSGGYVASVFGYKPVLITITGLDIFVPCDAEDKDQTIAELYSKSNAASPTYELLLVSTEADPGVVYECLIGQLSRSVQARNAQDYGMGVGTYTMKLIGARTI